jgi:hypothetical protein
LSGAGCHQIGDVDRAAGETGAASSRVLPSAKVLSGEGARFTVAVEKLPRHRPRGVIDPTCTFCGQSLTRPQPEFYLLRIPARTSATAASPPSWMTTMIDQEVLSVMAGAIVHANTEFRASGREPTWDEIVQINEQGDRLAGAVLAALRAAGYVVARN